MDIGPCWGARRSKVRINRSTPAVASVDERYLFQSCVSASEGWVVVMLIEEEDDDDDDVLWMGIESVKWLDADDGVRRSKIRR